MIKHEKQQIPKNINAIKDDIECAVGSFRYRGSVRYESDLDKIKHLLTGDTCQVIHENGEIYVYSHSIVGWVKFLDN